MNRAVTCEDRLGQPGQVAENALLLANAELRLESDEVVQHTGLVLLTKLDDGVRTLTGLRISQPNRLHRTVSERIAPAPRHLLHRQAALEEELCLVAMKRNRLGGQKRGHEPLVAFSIQRDVEVVALTLGVVLVARGAKHDAVIDRVRIECGRDRIVEVEVLLTQQVLQIPRHLGRGQGASRKDDDRIRRQRGYQLAHELDARVGLDRLGDVLGELHAVDRQRAASRDCRRIGGRENQRVEPPHLLLEESNRVAEARAAQRIATDELRQVVGAVRR